MTFLDQLRALATELLGVLQADVHAGLVRDGRDVGDVEDVVLRVGDGLPEEGLGIRLDRGPP